MKYSDEIHSYSVFRDISSEFSVPSVVFPANTYLFKVNNRKMCEICSELTIKTPMTSITSF